jgi:hypothetical protein
MVFFFESSSFGVHSTHRLIYFIVYCTYNWTCEIRVGPIYTQFHACLNASITQKFKIS